MSATNVNTQSPAQTADPKAPSSPQTEAQKNPGVASIAGSGGQSAEAVKEAAREAIRKLKIDDQEVDEDEVIKVYKDRKGHQAAASKQLQEGKMAKKQAEEFIQQMKDKGRLFEAIQKLGHNPRALAEEFLASQLEEDMLDPREKEFRATKKELDAIKAREKATQEAERSRQDAEMREKFSKDYSEKFVSALQESKLPATKAMVGKMASYIHRSAKIGFEMTPQEAAKLVREDVEEANRNLYGEADADTLVRLLGEPVLQKLRTYDTARLKSPEANLKTPQPATELRERPKKTGQRMSAVEWREFNRK